MLRLVDWRIELRLADWRIDTNPATIIYINNFFCISKFFKTNSLFRPVP